MDSLGVGIAVALGVFAAVLFCLGLGVVGYYAFHATVPPLGVADVVIRTVVVGALVAVAIGALTAAGGLLERI